MAAFPNACKRWVNKPANGAGSIYLDSSSGTYRATYVDPVTGKRRTVSARTKGEAEARRAAKLAQLVDGATKAACLTALCAVR